MAKQDDKQQREDGDADSDCDRQPVPFFGWRVGWRRAEYSRV